MAIISLDKANLRTLFTEVKFNFNRQIGEFTHKRVNDNWYYHSMSFIRDDMGYLFGFTVGVFRFQNPVEYDTAGVNVVVRIDGKNSELRQQYADFFRKYLPTSMVQNEYSYTDSDRGGHGIIFPLYKPISEFSSSREFIDYFKPGINVFKSILHSINEHDTNIFNHVVRAQRPWDENIVDFD